MGVVTGAGIAAHTSTGFVVGVAAEVQLWKRLGLIGGHGFRFASNDRVRHAWGLGVTFRGWSFSPSNG